MKDKDIYDNLFNSYQYSKNHLCNTLQDEFENELDILLSNDFDLYQNIINRLHNLLNETSKKYYIAGIKTALELFKY